MKALGDHSSSLGRLRPGTRVFIEGPYGAFTRHASRSTKAVLLAAGIGVTALRALLEDLPRRSEPVVVLRASRDEDLALRDEIAELVRQLGGRLHELVGPRRQHLVNPATLRRLVPDIAQRDLYVCGPGGFVDDVVGAARDLGIPKEAIHHEAFSL